MFFILIDYENWNLNSVYCFTYLFIYYLEFSKACVRIMSVLCGCIAVTGIRVSLIQFYFMQGFNYVLDSFIYLNYIHYPMCKYVINYDCTIHKCDFGVQYCN